MRMQRHRVVLAAMLFAGATAAQAPSEQALADASTACRRQPTQAQYETCMASMLEDAGQHAMREDAARAASSDWYSSVATRLAGDGGARELALAATLLQLANWTPAVQSADDGRPSQPVPVPAQANTWRREAAARAGLDVIANALLMHGDGGADTQVSKQAAERWAKAEPDNLAPLLFQDLSAAALLAAARSRTRFDLHGYDQVRWISDQFARHPPRETEARVLFPDAALAPEEGFALAAMAIWGATAIPAFQTVSEACGAGASEADAARLADCRHLAQVMAEASDSAVGESVGIGTLLRIARTDDERAAALSKRRAFDWRMQQWSRRAQQADDGGAADFARLLRDPAIRSEQVLVARLLAEANVPPDPPADWQPPRRK